MGRTLLALVACTLMSTQAAAQNPNESAPSALAGLRAAAEIQRDIYGIAHVRAGNDHDLYFMQGYVHAQDRLFQMDLSRRTASGTVAELLGPAALAGDVELRTIGIRRAAARSLAIISSTSLAALEAYAEGINAYVSAAALPAEYQALELTHFEPWTALDSMSVAKSIAFALSFSLEDIDNTAALLTYTAVFDPMLGAGTGRTLFGEDLWRSQPFFPASTVPDASLVSDATTLPAGKWVGRSDVAGAELAKKYAERDIIGLDGSGALLASAKQARPRPCPWHQALATLAKCRRGTWTRASASGRTPSPSRPNWGPMLATAGGVVFSSGANDRKFCAFDATTGKVLWEFPTNSGVICQPSSFMVDGRQFIAVQSGRGVDSRGMQPRLNGISPGDYPEVPEGGAIWVFAVPR